MLKAANVTGTEENDWDLVSVSMRFQMIFKKAKLKEDGSMFQKMYH